LHASIALNITHDLIAPKLPSRHRELEHRALMAVPEAAVNENDRFIAGEYQIWTPGEVSPV
jgi:hypothetical protein